MTLTLTTADLPEKEPTSPRRDRPTRLSFTSRYKLDVLAEYDAAHPQAHGVLLRREGCYSSHVSQGRKQRDKGAQIGDGAAAPAASVGRASAEERANAKLLGRAERAECELAKTKAELENVEKAHALLEMLSESAVTEKRSKPCSPRPCCCSPA